MEPQLHNGCTIAAVTEQDNKPSWGYMSYKRPRFIYEVCHFAGVLSKGLWLVSVHTFFADVLVPFSYVTIAFFFAAFPDGDDEASHAKGPG